MSVIGPEAIEIFNSLILDEEGKKNMTTIKQKSSDYFVPKVISYERFILFNVVQKDDETFDEFLTRIKTLASTCKFETLKDEMLKDKIDSGVKNSQVREKLLAEEELTLIKAVLTFLAS